MAFTDDYHQRKRKYEIQNLKKEIEYDKEYAEEEKELKMHPYTITLTPKVPFSETLLKEYEEAINEGLSGKGFRVRLEESK